MLVADAARSERGREALQYVRVDAMSMLSMMLRFEGARARNNGRVRNNGVEPVAAAALSAGLLTHVVSSLATNEADDVFWSLSAIALLQGLTCQLHHPQVCVHFLLSCFCVQIPGLSTV
jgi:hypothetical protein